MTDDPFERYDAAIAAIEQPITDMIAYAHRTRRLLRITALSVAFNAVLLALLGWSLARLSDLANDVERQTDYATQYQLANCEESNRSRAGERDLWAAIFAIEPETPRTARETKALSTIRRTVAKTYPTRDCSQVLIGKVK